ncbi:MAG: hypothetical protein R3B70_03060 [Polyangiaceae bacterium]
MPISQDSDGIPRSLQEAGVELVVVGGTAAVLQGAPVVTFDLDIVHRRTPENVSRLASQPAPSDFYFAELLRQQHGNVPSGASARGSLVELDLVDSAGRRSPR